MSDSPQVTHNLQLLLLSPDKNIACGACGVWKVTGARTSLTRNVMAVIDKPEGQSFTPVLLLLLCVEISQSKPIDFICDPELRRRMDVTESLDTLKVHACMIEHAPHATVHTVLHSKTLLLQKNCSDQLSSPVLCPCVRIHRPSWRQTPFQQKQAFVRDSLGALLQSLRSVRESLSLSCQILILEMLEHSVKNHLLIVNALERWARTSDQQISSSPPELSCSAREAASLTRTLSFYGRLVRGPVELLVQSLQHTRLVNTGSHVTADREEATITATMSERTPLLHYRLSASVNESGEHRETRTGRDEGEQRSPATVRQKPAVKQPPKLNTFFGVVIPTLLSMFSFVVGQCGLYQTIAMLLVAYFIISMTVLSVCAISTNGALDAGGAYYMISRALGPEFGGSIGIMFFLANVCGSALYVLGLVEAVLTTFGVPEDGSSLSVSRYAVLPAGYWWSLLYGTVILLLCLIVCLVGAHIYAKATFVIFIIVIVVLGTIFVSFFAVPFRTVQLPGQTNSSIGPTSANFTGFKLDTLMGNVQAAYTVDYTTGVMMTFATVFAVMFNGCTGIMAGSNMSGDLKSPSYSIPRGTITAVIFTFIIYSLLSVLISCTCDRILLQKDYGFLRDINVWHPFVTVGVYSSTLSAAMSNLIGASRILYALARDDLFGIVLSPAKRTSGSGNPWVSVLISWFLVQRHQVANRHVFVHTTTE
ncbi:Solute carrier family 12 member 9 [Anabarilius grahami]|uniref:Solute carrier family 12 member 9 n=1 Tax=Anabarilius grahami TaxID=495550 RepID=A0A3N0Z8C5_ANAGA|nr:Solute carrier family 12 member 9 [Anabarilius grahami]